MTGPASPPRFGRTPHLVTLIGEVASLAEQLRALDPDPALIEQIRERSLLATLALDGSPITELPDELVVMPEPGTFVAPRQDSSWYASFQMLDDAPDSHLMELEAAGAAAAYAADDLAVTILLDPAATLAELHARLTAGLIEPSRAGAPRTSEQAVHDAAVGRIIYYTSHPQTVPDELEALAGWITGPGAFAHGLITAGVIHLELLRIHPYDAASGRLARAAARLALRAAGLDPHGMAAAETVLGRDRLGYHEEVASTLRRRDLSFWLERWGDAVAEALRDAARETGLLTREVEDRPASFLEGREATSTFTVVDYRTDAQAEPDEASAELTALLDAGRIVRVPGSRGLRFSVR